MGSAGSVASLVEVDLVEELSKPLDCGDLKTADEAISEVKRLRLLLHQLHDKNGSKEGTVEKPETGVQENESSKGKGKKKNKWRRGSFGQIKKAEDYWEAQNIDMHKEENSEANPTGEVDIDNIERELKKMNEDIGCMLSPSPSKRSKKNR